MTEQRFDELLKELRDEVPPPEQVEDAQDRVWRRLAAARSRACEEVRPALADHAAGRLAESRRLLIEDHLGRCVGCRRALAEIQGARKVIVLPRGGSGRRPAWRRWAAAAAIVAAVLYVGRHSIDSALAPGGPRATVTSVSGTLYRLSGGALGPDAALSAGEVVRTAAGSRAVLRLADGTRLEMNERTELDVRSAWSGDTIRLDRGDIIVDVAEQRLGRLRVVTRDSIASARGTVFAVSSSTSGSLVSVVEGSVAVSQPGFEELLHAGQQAASSPALGQVGVQQAISWSQDAEQYYELLAELAGIEEQLAALAGQALRHDDRLVDYLPANTFAYVAIPNLDDTIREALYLFDERARQSAALSAWWTSSEGLEMRALLEHLQAITPMLGDEMVFSVSGDPGAGGEMTLVLARVRAGLEQALREAIDGLSYDSGETIAYQIREDLLLISGNLPDLATLSVMLGSGSSSPFATEIRRHYDRGVGWLAGFDVAALGLDDFQAEPGTALGLSNVRYLFLEQRTGGLGDDSEATLSFEGERHGVASWLAAPGAIGSVEYVSPEAVVVSSGSTRDPREAFDQLLAAFGPDSSPVREIREFEYETGVSLGDDIAASLGTDFTIAIERPTVPVPGWVTAFEALNPGALDEAVRRLVDAFNAQLSPEDVGHRLSFVQETVDGRAWRSLSSADADFPEFAWTYDRGYLIASADRGLALRAIGVRQSGSSLIRSAAFQQQYPLGSGLHNSGFFWLNTGGVAEELAALVDSPALAGLAASRDPVLVVVTGDDERIHWASRTRLTSLVFDVLLAGPIGEASGEAP